MFTDPKTAFEHQHTHELLRTLLVLGLCSFPPFVQQSGRLLEVPSKAHNTRDTVSTSSPTLPGWLRDALYRHFCAGAGPLDVWTVMNRLRANNVGAILELAEEHDDDDVDGVVDTHRPPTRALHPWFTPGPTSDTHRDDFEDDDIGIVSNVVGDDNDDAVLRTMPLHEYRSEQLCERRLEALLSAVDTAAALPGPGFCALRLPALGDRRLLVRLSSALEAVLAPFRACDADGDGFISHAEFEACYERLAAGQGGKASIALELSRIFIEDGFGRVDFVSWVQRLDIRRVLSLAAGLHRQAPAGTAGTAAGPEAAGNRWQLSAAERQQLRALFARLDRLVERAVAKGVRVMIDAEHGPLRPAVDHIAHCLMRRHNRPAARPNAGGSVSGSGGAAVLATYQAYLRDTPQRLAADLGRAERTGYTLGAKLVCGAYLPMERRWAAGAGRPPPVWDSAAQTHACFDACAALLLDGVSAGGAEAMLATNNAVRVGAAVAGMAARGLQPGAAPVYFAQMLGMADNLSFTLGGSGHKVYKFCPYGAESRVRPYLVRRVHETQRALQAGRQDLRLVQAELWRRLAGTTFPPAPAKDDQPTGAHIGTSRSAAA